MLVYLARGALVTTPPNSGEAWPRPYDTYFLGYGRGQPLA